MTDLHNKIIALGIDPALRNTGIAITLLTPLMTSPEIIETYRISHNVREISLHDQAKFIRRTKDRIKETIMTYRPNVVGMEKHNFSFGRRSDSVLNEVDGVIKDLFLDLRDYLVVPFPILISPQTLKKWLDCAKAFYDNKGRKIIKQEKKALYIKKAREVLNLGPDISEDEIEAVIMCQIVSAWAMPESRFVKNLQPKQQEVIIKIEQEGETDIDDRSGLQKNITPHGRQPTPGQEEINLPVPEKTEDQGKD